MQHIPDNEFDRLFKDRLADADVQPSRDLWAHIAPELALKKKKRNVYVYWSAAATVLVALSAGLLFKPQEKIALHAPVASSTLEVSSSLSNDKVNQEAIVSGSAEKEPNHTVDQRNIDEVSDISAKRNAEVVVTQPVEKSLVAMQPTDENDHHINTKIEEPKAKITTKVETAIAETALASNSNPVAEVPEMTTALNEAAEVEQPSKPKIRNAGDLVNFVVDKLDKREQKFVEFRTDDDEGTSLVAINIGPLKINQRRSR